MTTRWPRFALVGVGVFLVSWALAAPPRPEAPQAERDAKLADDPLPPGAEGRLGVSHFILRTTPMVGLVPPGYTTMLAPTMTGGIRPYDVKTGRPLQNQGIVGPGQVVVSADGK